MTPLLRWMVATNVLAALMVVAAWGADAVCALTGRARRAVWGVALVVASVWPPVAWFALDAPQDTTRQMEVTAPTAASTPPPLDSAASSAGPPLLLQSPVLLGAWGLASLLLAVRALMGLRAVRRVVRTARAGRVDGHDVVVTAAAGPAVTGLLRPTILWPEWLFALDAELRALVLQHEREHVRARDPLLVMGAIIATTVMPWNAPLWYLAFRLRAAVEADCDRRVLHRYPDTARYGRLLVLVAQRSMPLPALAHLLHPATHLARRLELMQRTVTPSWRALRVVASSVVVIATGIAACSPRVVGNLAGPTPEPAAAAEASPRPTSATRPAVMAPGQKGPAYPDSLRATRTEGRVMAQFVIDSAGQAMPATLKILKSDHPQLTAAVRDGLRVMRFLPAEVDGRRVRQLAQQVYDFRMNGERGYAVIISPVTNPAASR